METKEQKPWYQGVKWADGTLRSVNCGGRTVAQIVVTNGDYDQGAKELRLVQTAPETATQRDSLLSVQKQLVEALEELRWVGNDLRERKAARAKADAAIQAAKASS